MTVDKVYVLLGSEPFEGDYLLGVYLTADEARVFAGEHKRRSRLPHAVYRVAEITIGAPPNGARGVLA